MLWVGDVSKLAAIVMESREEVDTRLQEIMRNIHGQCVKFGTDGDYVDYVNGANLAGFVKVADAMRAYGVV